MYQLYQKDQDQISGATYISDVVFCIANDFIHVILIHILWKPFHLEIEIGSHDHEADGWIRRRASIKEIMITHPVWENSHTFVAGLKAGAGESGPIVVVVEQKFVLLL